MVEEIMVEKKKNIKKDQSLLSLGLLILTALVFSILFRGLLFEPFKIPSGSMKPGLIEGDHILVSKYSYGYSKYSFPFDIIPIKDRLFFNEPVAGDVIVFRLPSNPKINYIKRLIGKPGDVIQVKMGRLFINGELIPIAEEGEFVDTTLVELGGVVRKIKQFKEKLNKNREYLILDERRDSIGDNTIEFKVPKEHYFFMGDNRDNSADSRFIDEVGFVHQQYLIGKARIIFFSSNESIFKIWKIFQAVKFDRFFKIIQ